MTRATIEIGLRMRLRVILGAAVWLIMACVMVGALFPSLGDSIGKLNLPKGVADLLGGADYSTLSGWMKSEVVSILGPLIVAGVAISNAAATTAGEEEDRITGLLLSHPVRRSRLLLAKAAAVGAAAFALGVASFIALVSGVAVAGGGIGAGDIAARSLHLTFLGFSLGALALALGAATGERTLASGGTASVAALMFLINGFAPVVHAISWLKYFSVFHYYSGHDPLTNGVNFGDLAVLAALTAALVIGGLVGFERRDIKA